MNMHVTILCVKILVNNKLSPRSREVIVDNNISLSPKFLFYGDINSVENYYNIFQKKSTEIVLLRVRRYFEKLTC
jgi:hypothetical protein